MNEIDKSAAYKSFKVLKSRSDQYYKVCLLMLAENINEWMRSGAAESLGKLSFQKDLPTSEDIPNGFSPRRLMDILTAELQPYFEVSIVRVAIGSHSVNCTVTVKTDNGDRNAS